MLSMSLTNLKSAFVHPFNLIALASFGALSGALVDLKPVMAGGGIEVLYLLVSTISPAGTAVNRFIYWKPFGEIRLFGQKTPIEMISKPTVLPLLRPEVQQQYNTLEFHVASILKTIGSEVQISNSVKESLDYLLNKFLLFAVRELEFRERLVILVDEAEALNPSDEAKHRPHLKIVASANDAPIEEPIPSLMARAASAYEAEIKRSTGRQSGHMVPDQDESADRATILRRRARHAERVGKALQNVRLEMNKIGVKIQGMDEDGLAAAPAQALKDLKGLIVETDSVTRTIEQIEPLEELGISQAA